MTSTNIDEFSNRFNDRFFSLFLLFFRLKHCYMFVFRRVRDIFNASAIFDNQAWLTLKH